MLSISICNQYFLFPKLCSAGNILEIDLTDVPFLFIPMILQRIVVNFLLIGTLESSKSVAPTSQEKEKINLRKCLDKKDVLKNYHVC